MLCEVLDDRSHIHRRSPPWFRAAKVSVRNLGTQFVYEGLTNASGDALWHNTEQVFVKFGCLMLLVSLLASCSQTKEQNAAKPSAASQAESTECVRGEPVALLGPEASEFRRLGKLEALETVRGDGSVEVRIRHFGCTAFALDFEITWKVAPAKRSDEAASVIRGLRVRESNRAVINQIADAMKQLRNDGVPMSETESLTVIPELEPNKFRLRYELTL